MMDESEKNQIGLFISRRLISYIRKGIYIPVDMLQQETFQSIPLVAYQGIDHSSEEVHLSDFDATGK
jgi:hypothetical protein